MDPDLVVDPVIKQHLLDGGMDDLLATHFAHLFIRDPLVIFSEDLRDVDVINKTDHFENIQSTNWQHIRFKPPPPDKDTGWRVEFRPMEIQMTDFENAAFSIFVVLITRAILSFDLNFYLPIPLTTANMETAHKRDAVLHEKFHFRSDVMPPRRHRSTNSSAANSAPSTGLNTPVRPPTPVGPVEDEHTLMTVDEIINGQRSDAGQSAFPGLIPLVEAYLSSMNIDVETRCSLARYLDLIRKRASGKLQTNANWIRQSVAKHPLYQHDSVVSAKMTYDLLEAVNQITIHEGQSPLSVGLLPKA